VKSPATGVRAILILLASVQLSSTYVAAAAERDESRSSEALAQEAEAALQKKDYAGALPALEELVRRRDQWGAFMLGNYFICGKVVAFSCARAQELFLISLDPKIEARADPELSRRSKNEIAWINAACEQPGFSRDSGLALRLGIEAARERIDPFALDTVAAAFAGAGNYADAVSLQRTAIGILEQYAASEPVTETARNAFDARLALYARGERARFDASTADQQCNAFD
jgi:hypothetical protein